MQKQKEENQCFYQNVQRVIVKKSRFIKECQASGLLSSLGIKTGLDKTPTLGPIFFFKGMKWMK